MFSWLALEKGGGRQSYVPGGFAKWKYLGKNVDNSNFSSILTCLLEFLVVKDGL